MGGLADLHLRHPEKDFARVEIAKNPAFKLQQKRRMKRITQIEQGIWPGETIYQLSPRHPDTTHSRQVVDVVGWLLMKQTVLPLKSIFAQTALKALDPRFVSLRIQCR